MEHDDFICWLVHYCMLTKCALWAAPNADHQPVMLCSAMEEQACVSGVVGLHVSCICTSVYFSLQQGPSRQTMKFRMRLRFRFCEQPVPRSTASSCHTLSAWHCPTWEAAASGRLQDAQPGKSVPSPPKFHHACGKKILEEKVSEGENCKFGERNSLGSL